MHKYEGYPKTAVRVVEAPQQELLANIIHLVPCSRLPKLYSLHLLNLVLEVKVRLVEVVHADVSILSSGGVSVAERVASNLYISVSQNYPNTPPAVENSRCSRDQNGL